MYYKALFWKGFVVGILFSIVVILWLYNDTEGMLLDILLFVPNLIIKGMLEYLLRLVSLQNILQIHIVTYGLVSITNGVFFGLIGVCFRRMFGRTFN